MQDRKKDTDVYNVLLDSEGEGEGGMIWENGILTYIHHVRIESPIYVWRRIQHAWDWCMKASKQKQKQYTALLDPYPNFEPVSCSM